MIHKINKKMYMQRIDVIFLLFANPSSSVSKCSNNQHPTHTQTILFIFSPTYQSLDVLVYCQNCVCVCKTATCVESYVVGSAIPNRYCCVLSAIIGQKNNRPSPPSLPQKSHTHTCRYGNYTTIHT